jgi:hypothetical protein
VRMLIASFLVAHGLAHVVGFLAPSYQPSMLMYRLDGGVAAMKTVGVLWVFAATAFMVAAAGLAADVAWGPAFTGGTALFSLALSLVESPRAHMGVYINVAILIGLALYTFGVRF